MENYLPSWRLIYTRAKHERKVAYMLGEFGINYFLPTVKLLRQWRDRKKMIEVPLFPSYIFVSIMQKEDFYKSLQIDGTINYVRFGKEIATVRDSVIENLRIITSNGKSIEVSTEKFKPGQQLIVQKGLLRGLSCEVIDHKNRKKIIVRMHLLNRSVLACFPSSGNYLTSNQIIEEVSQ